MSENPKKNIQPSRLRIRELLNPAPPKPVWGEWKSVIHAPLWEAIALSCNIDPIAIRGWQKHISKFKPTEDYIIRFRQAESDRIEEILRPSFFEPGVEPQFALTSIREWCEIRAHFLPSEFPCVETTAERNERIKRRYVELLAQGKEWGVFSKLAKEFGISRQYVSDVVKGG